MKSFDTNILVYAANRSCDEHAAAKLLVDEALGVPEQWIIADQVAFELYRALRSPRVLAKPLNAAEAMGFVSFVRDQAGFSHCAYELDMFAALATQLEQADFPSKRTHDAVLAETLRRVGVTTFYTRNVKDFADAAFAVVNPID